MMSIQSQLCTFRTADQERLHGLLFTPPAAQSDLALVFVHGVAMNFYLPPLATFGQELAKRGFHSFVINTRGVDRKPFASLEGLRNIRRLMKICSPKVGEVKVEPHGQARGTFHYARGAES